MSPRLALAGGGIVVVLVLVILLQGAWGDRDKARREAAAAQASAVVADGRGELAGDAGAAVEAARIREVTVTVQAKEAAHELAIAPGGEAPVPADVLAGWAGAVDRLRLEAAGAAPGRDAADPGGGDAAGPLPAPAAAGGP